MSVLTRLQQGVLDWYHGPWVAYKNDYDSDVFIVGGSHHPHWSAKVAQAVVKLLSAEWKWVSGTLIALMGLIITFKKL